jgi:hypothetical protein
VSQDFGELGFTDLMFEDADNRTLLVKVEVKADELDKAFSQILRHRPFFAQQNWRKPLFVLVSPVCSYHRFVVSSVSNTASPVLRSPKPRLMARSVADLRFFCPG